MTEKRATQSNKQERLSGAYLRSIPCNTEVSLQIITPTQAIRVRTHLIGVDRQLCVILHRGDDANWLIAKEYIREGQSVVVRLISANERGAKVIAFRSNIIKLISTIGRWLVIDYPKQLHAYTLRTLSRLPVKINAALLKEPDTPPISQGVIQDISLKGACYLGTALTAQLSKPQTPLLLELRNSQGEPQHQLAITIQKSLNKPKGYQQLGLKFTPFLETFPETIRDLLLESLYD